MEVTEQTSIHNMTIAHPQAAASRFPKAGNSKLQRYEGELLNTSVFDRTPHFSVHFYNR